MEKVKPPHSSTSVPFPKPVPNPKVQVPKQEVNKTVITADTELKAFVPEPETAPEPKNKPTMPQTNMLNDILPYLGIAGAIVAVALVFKKTKK